MAENVPPPPRGPSPTAGISPPSLETWKIETKSRGIGRNRRRGGGLLRVFYLCRINQNGNFPIFGGCRGDFGGILGGFGDSKMAPTPPPPRGNSASKWRRTRGGSCPSPTGNGGVQGILGNGFPQNLNLGDFFPQNLEFGVFH